MPEAARRYIMDIVIGLSATVLAGFFTYQVYPILGRVEALEKELITLREETKREYSILYEKTEALEYNDRETRKFIFGGLPKTSKSGLDMWGAWRDYCPSDNRYIRGGEEFSFSVGGDFCLCGFPVDQAEDAAPAQNINDIGFDRRWTLLRRLDRGLPLLDSS